MSLAEAAPPPMGASPFSDSSVRRVCVELGWGKKEEPWSFILNLPRGGDPGICSLTLSDTSKYLRGSSNCKFLVI